ncbi:MAG: MMPL family transporter [Candidatus Aminicenantes bacterium]|nr:MMPL family transporter [Candidatus Aminicenantes bacterium]NIM80392.1 MMPL family transporter [Candidatus Aminicenantes bacterium]NIN19779.1 MMPL family transporter [Candidatus Aminicenantes bacterium]NIN43661.1 MMPL family transporter [Candidatus Aminicenantes bacterium]NIN86406.1 MMPL family transporter [Candidatus Aminicenantes bacterium]
MKIPGISIQNYQFTIIVVILLVLSGIISVIQMPKSEDPAVAKPGASIFIIYAGATSADLEQLVVDPVEEVLNELDDIKKIESNCYDGLAAIAVEFLAGSDPDDKYSEVTEQINSIREKLPPDILRLETMKWSIAETKFLQIALVSEDADYRELEKQAQRLEKILKKIPGIKRADIWAFPEQEVRVSLDQEKMAQLKIPFKRVLGAVHAANMNIPGGTIDAGIKRFSIQTSGSYESIEQIKYTVIHSEGTKVVYLKDVADVYPTHEDTNYFARFNGQRCVFVTATQKEDTNIFNIMKALKEKVAEFEKKLPENIKLAYVYDQSASVTGRLTVFFSNLVQGIILVGIVILIAIGIRGSIIVMMAIPISLLMAIGFVYKSGYGIQQMTIAGLVITLGLLVDNAIVVVENITRFIKKGETNLDAAVKGTSQIGWAIVSATATTILAFLPIVMMRDVSGDFIRSMPLTVIYTLTASLFIALTFTPFLSSKILRTTEKRKESKLMKLFERFIEKRYRKWLDFALRKPAVIVVLALGFFFGSLALFPLVGVSMFPKAEKKMFFIEVNLPEGSSILQTDNVVGDVEKYLQNRDEVDRYAANIGRSNPRIYYNVISRRPQSNIGHVFVRVKETVSRKQMAQFIQKMRDEFDLYPGARIEIKELEQGPPVNAPVEIKVRGEKIDVLEKIARDIENIFRRTPGLINVSNPLGTSKSDIRVKVNRDKAAMYGIPLVDIDRTVRMSIAGITVSKYRDKDGKEYNIVVRSDFEKEGRPKLDIFDKIYFTTAMGALIPLNQVATVELKLSSSKISHFNLDRSATITADVLRGYSVNKVTREVISKLEQYRWPVGYHYFVGGEQESREESFGGMGEAVVIAIISIFAVLVLQFKSFKQPLIVFAALPLAIIGSILALLITGYTFSFTAFIGITSLVGIVVNNSIILVDYTNQLRRGGKELVTAIKQAGETRFLPIILTTMTTIGGLLPLTLQGGTLWAPMGWTIIGGLLTSTFLTLIVVPVLYKMFSNHKRNNL